MLVMKEEIFGPLLPLKVYDELSEVVNYINNHDHPLGFYISLAQEKEKDYVLKYKIRRGYNQ
ncbi:MAG: hypothetical protein CM15mP12_0990 [Gammaproteobacteria bacterium]|nr:MAG: hypothetical protein CM15mP12_0990 [Gammaproteobacteria bacterium]